MKRKIILITALLALGWGLRAQTEAPNAPLPMEEENSLCQSPIDLRSTFVNNNELYSITFNWTPQGEETRWNIVITSDSIGGFNVDIDATLNAPQYTIISHTVGLRYLVQVRALCSDSSQSEWVSLSYQEPHWADIAETDVASQVALYPNPARERATLDLTGINGAVRADLCETSGRAIRSWNLDGDSTTTLDLHGIDKGCYMLIIKDRNNIISKKIIVQ